MKSGSADRLDPEIADLLRTAAPYPDAPADVQARVEKAVAVRIAEMLAAGVPDGSDDGAIAAAMPRANGLISLAAKPVRRIAATFLVGAAAGAGLHAAIQPPRGRIVYVERAPASLAPTAPSVEATGSAQPEMPLAHDVESPQASRPSAALPAKSASHRPFDLGPEQALLDLARRALADGRSAEALGPLDRHAQRYPKGILAEEREALAINVLVTLGRYDEARLRSAQFLRRYPTSLLRGSVDAAVNAIP